MQQNVTNTTLVKSTYKFGKEIPLSSEPLSETNQYLLESFSCGNLDLDNHIKRHYNDYNVVTRIVIDTKLLLPVCVYSLCCTAMLVESSNKVYPSPAVEIETFAVNESYQDIYFDEDKDSGCISNIIFDKVCWRIMNFTDEYCGANNIVLYATEDGYPFYLKSGFQPFPEYVRRDGSRFLDGCNPMFFTLR